MSNKDRYSSSAGVESAASLRWSAIVVCFTIGIVAVEFMIRRPMMREMASLRSNIVGMQRDMESLVGVHNQAWETNNLLSSLKAQYRQIEDGRASIESIKRLNEELETETAKLSKAFASLDQLINIKNRVLKQSETNPMAQSNLDQMVALQDRISNNSEGTQHAFVAVNGLLRLRDTAKIEIESVDSAITSVRQLGELKREVIEKGDSVVTAREQLSDLVALKNDLYEEASNIPEARKVADDLLSLKNEMRSKAAVQQADQLIALRNTLSSIDSTSAKSNLEQLVGLQDTLNSQTKQVSEAVQTLELLTDLGDQLKEQVDATSSMRKSLMEIVLLESTVHRVARVLEPLTQLGNLRRLSDDELREAARSVIDARQSRVARRPVEGRVEQRDGDSLKLNNLRLFPDEPSKDVPVPMPPSEDLSQVIDSLQK